MSCASTSVGSRRTASRSARGLLGSTRDAERDAVRGVQLGFVGPALQRRLQQRDRLLGLPQAAQQLRLARAQLGLVRYRDNRRFQGAQRFVGAAHLLIDRLQQLPRARFARRDPRRAQQQLLGGLEAPLARRLLCEDAQPMHVEAVAIQLVDPRIFMAHLTRRGRARRARGRRGSRRSVGRVELRDLLLQIGELGMRAGELDEPSARFARIAMPRLECNLVVRSPLVVRCRSSGARVALARLVERAALLEQIGQAKPRGQIIRCELEGSPQLGLGRLGIPDSQPQVRELVGPARLGRLEGAQRLERLARLGAVGVRVIESSEARERLERVARRANRRARVAHFASEVGGPALQIRDARHARDRLRVALLATPGLEREPERDRDRSCERHTE
ncbi:MAG TPA: hypothetical protein VEC18_10605 [Myxococcota bacterium]|nr:hypothetical protein [Myxococcota bacterium]